MDGIGNGFAFYLYELRLTMPTANTVMSAVTMLLEEGSNRLSISILDYEEAGATYRVDRNALLTSLEVQLDGKSSIVTAPLVSTHELSALANWFEQVAAGNPTDPVVLLEPCLFFDCLECARNAFRVTVRMEAEASPNWTKYYVEPLEMSFWLTDQQMLETARSLRRLHQAYPTQS